MKADLLGRLGLELHRGSPAERLAARIVMGAEIQHLQRMLGLEGSGRRLVTGVKWSAWSREQLGLTEDTAGNMVKVFCAAKRRLATQPRSGALLASLQGQPSKASRKERGVLVAGLVAAMEGCTQAELLAEARGHRAKQGGKANLARIGAGNQVVALRRAERKLAKVLEDLRAELRSLR